MLTAKLLIMYQFASVYLVLLEIHFLVVLKVRNTNLCKQLQQNV